MFNRLSAVHSGSLTPSVDTKRSPNIIYISRYGEIKESRTKCSKVFLVTMVAPLHGSASVCISLKGGDG